MFSGEHSANDISSELVIGGSRRCSFRHSQRLPRSKSAPAQAEVAASHGKDSREEVRTRQVPSASSLSDLGFLDPKMTFLPAT
jgi:hypothetical protein